MKPLKIVFGTDQEAAIDYILASFFPKTKFNKKSHKKGVAYSIHFKNLFDAYLFGHAQASTKPIF